MSNKTSAKKFNVFDVVVILLVISLIATFVYQIYAGVDKVSGKNRSQYILSFECDSSYNSVLKYLKDGDAVFFEADGTLLGYLSPDEENENGAIFEIIDDIPTFADAEDAMAESESEGSDQSVDEASLYSNYKIIKIGGQIAMNIDTVKVKNGGYYSVGDINVTEGSVIKVYTDTVEFIITVKNIRIVE